MQIDLAIHLNYELYAATDLLLMIEAADGYGQRIATADLVTSTVDHTVRRAGVDVIGERVWLRADRQFVCDYTAQIDVTRAPVQLSGLRQTALHALPGEAMKYLLASRFCQSDEFLSFVGTEFPDLSGGDLVAALCDWVAANLVYLPGVSHAGTTARDTFIQRCGICRDFAHLLITLVRAAAIPARMVSVYAPHVTPQDFHAVAEVYLDGAWHLVDPTGMSSATETVVIGVGRDAADIAFLTSYGNAFMLQQNVAVSAG